MFVDTHAHIHFDDYADRLPEIMANSAAAEVGTIICVGVDEKDSAKAVALVDATPGVAGEDTPGVALYATAGLHPHDASHGYAALKEIARLADNPKVVAIGECGLDFYRNLSGREEQITAFRFQIELALKLKKPMVWHVRDAFDDFFEITDQYPGVKGIVHCFTSNKANMQKAVDRGFLVALNGIMTFTKDQDQLEAARLLPLKNLVLETDCPFLTPSPLRGKANEPANLKHIAAFLAELRGESLQTLSEQTTKNSLSLFGLK